MLNPFNFKKIIIIKTGQYETFTEDTGSSISLGDVFRSTCLLGLKKVLPESVSLHWLTSPAAISLVPQQNQTNVEIFSYSTLQNLLDQSSCLIINLERSLDLRNSNLFKIIEASSNHDLIGYFFDKHLWKIKDHNKSEWHLASWLDYCERTKKKTWGEMLSLLVGLDLPTKHGLILKPKVTCRSDIGINWKSGAKWPEKFIPISEWETLVEKLALTYTVSWQKGFDNLDTYIQWISSNKLIISLDSLGLHLATGLKIPVIGLFGRTPWNQVDFGDFAHVIPYQPDSEIKMPIQNVVESVDRFFNHSLYLQQEAAQ